MKRMIIVIAVLAVLFAAVALVVIQPAAPVACYVPETEEELFPGD